MLSAAVFHLRRAFLPVFSSSFVYNLDVDVVCPYRAPAANSHLAVAISVSFRKLSSAVLPFAVLNSCCSVRASKSSVFDILSRSFL